MNNKRGVLLVSLSSELFTSHYFDHVIDQMKGKLSSLTVFFLDELEKGNLRNIDNMSESDITLRIKMRCDEIQSDLAEHKVLNTETVGWAQFSRNHDLIKFVDLTRKVYEENKSFRNHCINQTYRNLQPILYKKGIRKSRHPMVSKLVNYLLFEISLKLLFNYKKIFDIEIAPRPEMEIIEKIYGGKYIEFSQYIEVKHEFRVIEPVSPQNNLRLQNVNFEYKKDKNKFRLIDISINIDSGETYGILGGNGSGKTTILRLIGGHLKPDSGTIWLGENDMTHKPPNDRPISTVFQDLGLFPHLTIESNIAYGLKAHKKYSTETINSHVKKQLMDYNLHEWRHSFPDQLSGGTKQRVAFARSTVTKPLVLLLDEVSSSQDVRQRQSIISALKDIKKSISLPTILIVSHDRDFILSLCENVSILSHGRICESGNSQYLFKYPPSKEVAEIMDSGNLVEGYLDNEMNFKSSHGDITFEVDNLYSNLKASDCLFLIRRDNIKFNYEKLKKSIGLSVTIIEVKSKGNFISLNCISKQNQFLSFTLMEQEYKQCSLKEGDSKLIYISTEAHHLLAI